MCHGTADNVVLRAEDGNTVIRIEADKVFLRVVVLLQIRKERPERTVEITDALDARRLSKRCCTQIRTWVAALCAREAVSKRQPCLHACRYLKARIGPRMCIHRMEKDEVIGIPQSFEMADHALHTIIGERAVA